MNSDNQPQAFRAMPQPQKIAVIILALLGVAVIIFWFLQFRAQLTRPFNPAGESQTTNTTVIDSQKLDTDSDGLSDYDEVNVYRTSPYLEDSDSSGVSDGEEIRLGTDPNCPEELTGKKCDAAGEIATSSASSFNQNYTLLGTNAENSGATGSEEIILQNMMNGQLDAATLRQLLIASGASQEDLDKISDEDLMASYQEALKNQNNQ